MSCVNPEYKKILRQIYANKDPIRNAISFFSNTPVLTFKKYAPFLIKEPFFKAAFCGTSTPKDICNLGKCGNMPLFPDISHALYWNLLVFLKCKNEIQSFLNLQNQYSLALLLGDYSRCFQLLDEIHEKYGYSMWELECRIFLLCEADSYEAEDQYTKSIFSALEKGSVERYRITCFSRQCKQNVSSVSFLSMLDSDYQRFQADGLSEEFCKYVRHTLTKSAFSTTRETTQWSRNTVCLTLFCDDKDALIDRFLGFKALSSVVFNQQNLELQNEFFPIVAALSKEIKDPMFDNLTHLWQQGFTPFHILGCDEICQAVDAYTIGHYEECICLTGQLLQKNAMFFPLVDIYAKCCAFMNGYQIAVDVKCPLDQILQKLGHLYTQTGDVQETQRDLVRLAYTHLDEPWSRELLLLVEKYADNLCSLEIPVSAPIHSGISLPSTLFSFDNQFIDAFFIEATEVFRSSISVQFAVAIRKQELNTISKLPIDYIRKKKYMAVLLMEQAPEQSVKIINILLNSPACTPISLELIAMQIDGCLRCGKLLEAMTYFVNTYLTNSNFVYFGHADRIFDALKSGDVNVQSSILAPISCSIYLNHFADSANKNDIVLYACYEEYLESHGIHIPSELLVSIQPDVLSLCDIYFFSQVCVPRVMDRSMAFKTSEDVLRERIIICTHLTTLDPNYQKQYTEEVHRLTNTLMIQMRKREVETSKIYTDISGIKLLLTKNLSESYERYISSKKMEKMDLEEKVQRLMQSLSKSENSYSVLLLQPDSMLQDILKQIRDIFVADSKYGLDGYLSVRIRHGTLESQLRSCFERLSLVTTKGADGNYQRNEFWLQEAHVPVEQEDSICQILSRFSSRIDEMILHIKRDLIQIKTEEKNPQGLFDFTVDSHLISWIESRIDESAPFEVFETTVLDTLLDITENSLQEIRYLLTTKTNKDFLSILDDLQMDLHSYEHYLNLRDLRNKIATARTEVSKELGTIAEWFRLTRPDSFQDYCLSLAVGISCKIMESFSSNISYVQNVDPKIQLKGSTLPSVVDIFNTLLDNVIKHSEGQIPRTANITIRQTGQAVDIEIQNPAELNGTSIERIEQILSHLSEWEKAGGVSREGGSGLLKVKKILSVDLRCNSKITYAYQDHSFTLNIHAELGDVLL